MASYARKTCSSCGIRLPQPEMCERMVTPTSVRGVPLSPRLKWFCRRCAPPSPWEQMTRKMEQEKIAKQDAIYNEKKKLWQEEQEQRRLANQAKRHSYEK